MADESFIVRCSNCGQKNRAVLRAGVSCGRCKAPLAKDMADAMVSAASERGKRERAEMFDDIRATMEKRAREKDNQN